MIDFIFDLVGVVVACICCYMLGYDKARGRNVDIPLNEQDFKNLVNGEKVLKDNATITLGKINSDTILQIVDDAFGKLWSDHLKTKA